MDIQRLGGIAATLLAAAYIAGMAIFILILNPDDLMDPLESVVFLMENEEILFFSMVLIYVVSGSILVVLVQALHERLKIGSPIMIQTASVFGFIWAGVVIAAGMIYIIGLDTVVELYVQDPASAASVWLTVSIVFEGLGGGVEFIGGLWTLLISLIALRSKLLPKALNFLGMAVGIAGVITIAPIFEDLTVVFGLGQIPWFLWLGIILLRSNSD